jgi:transcriptional regulator with XRE-family HTH domain
MPFPVENIRSACAQKGTTLAEIERDLGIGNGVIAKWKKAKGYPPYDRIQAIAKRLDVPVERLTGEEQKSPALRIEDEADELTDDIKDIIKELRDMTPAELALVKEKAQRIKGLRS